MSTRNGLLTEQTSSNLIKCKNSKEDFPLNNKNLWTSTWFFFNELNFSAIANYLIYSEFRVVNSRVGFVGRVQFINSHLICRKQNLIAAFSTDLIFSIICSKLEPARLGSQIQILHERHTLMSVYCCENWMPISYWLNFKDGLELVHCLPLRAVKVKSLAR